MKIRQHLTVNASNHTEDQMNSELEKGYTEMLNGEVKLAKGVFANIRKDFQITQEK